MATILNSRTAMTGLGLLLLCLFAVSIYSANFPDPENDIKPDGSKTQTAVLAGGCFWCTEAVFEHIEGVEKVVSGYSGGEKSTAHYEIVSTGRTGHAESIEVTFDPSKITYGQILKVFFDVAHDPTQLNHQGPDYGTQYRSAIFYANDEQKRVAEAYIQQLEKAHVYKKPIVTEVVPLKAFYPAEGYHQKYCDRHPNNPYIMMHAVPKVEKAKKQLPGLIKKD